MTERNTYTRRVRVGTTTTPLSYSPLSLMSSHSPRTRPLPRRQLRRFCLTPLSPRQAKTARDKEVKRLQMCKDESEGEAAKGIEHEEKCARQTNLAGKTVAIVGLGASGIAAAKLACDRDVKKLVLMDRAEKPTETQSEALRELEGVRGMDVDVFFGKHEPEHFSDVDVAVMSPGVPLARIEDTISRSKSSDTILVTSEFAFAVAEIQEEGIPIAAITGTNGKTTVTSFVAQLLTALGKKCISCGNIGRPLSDVALSLRREKQGAQSQSNGAGNGSSREIDVESLDALVVEVSSYQLEIPSAFHPKVAVVLNLTQDHMERHGDMTAYAKAKASVCANMLKEDDLIVVPKGDELIREQVALRNSTCKRVTIGDFPGVWVSNNTASVQLPWWFTHRDFRLGDLSRTCLGEHNAWNAAVAILVCFALGFEWPVIKVAEAIAQLKTPPHRLEILDTVDGVNFVNDSKATNIDAARVGITSLGRPSVVLLGGEAKRLGNGKLGFGELVEVLSKQKAVITFGQDREQISKELDCEDIECIGVATLKDAVAKAFEISTSGDTVLLSPACASFDEFKNFEHRGESFKRYVEKL